MPGVRLGGVRDDRCHGRNWENMTYIEQADARCAADAIAALVAAAPEHRSAGIRKAAEEGD